MFLAFFICHEIKLMDLTVSILEKNSKAANIFTRKQPLKSWVSALGKYFCQKGIFFLEGT